MNADKKTILLVLSLFLSFLILSQSAFSQGCADNPYGSTDCIETLSPLDISQAIASGDLSNINLVSDAKLGEAIESNPKILEKIGNTDLARALENRLALLDNSGIFKNFDSRVQTDISLVNNNREIREKWFSRYRITDKGMGIKTYDGTSVTTSGKRTTNFNINDFPGAYVLKDGSLAVGQTVFMGTSSLRAEKDASQERYYTMSGGKASLIDKTAISLIVNQGEVIFDGEVKYSSSGSFKFRQEQKGDETIRYLFSEDIIIREEEANRGWKTRIKGGVGEFQVKNAKGEYQGAYFGLGSGAEMTNHRGIKVTSLQAGGRDSLFYSEDFTPEICKSQVSCIINLKDGKYKEGDIEILKMASYNGDKFKVEIGRNRFDRISFNEVEGTGEIQLVGTDKNKKEIVLGVTEGGEIIQKGKLSQLTAGRVDVFYKEDNSPTTCQTERCQVSAKMIKHWSSIELQKNDVKNYFRNSRGNRDSFVACEETSCEAEFARNFGKVIKPQGGGKPKITVLLGGDNANTVSGMEKTCEEYGCYILNSRDMPTKTNSEVLVVTGHHWSSGYITRTNSQPSKEATGYIDAVFFDEFPEGNVKKVYFSSCYTMPSQVSYKIQKDRGEEMPRYLKGLKERYPDSLELIGGYYGMAPSRENWMELDGDLKLNSEEVDPKKTRFLGARWIEASTDIKKPLARGMFVKKPCPPPEEKECWVYSHS